jgi:hypothetical protein
VATSAATDLREQALAKFLEAKEIIGDDGSVAPEKLEAFNAKMSEAKDLDKSYRAAAAGEGNVVSLRDSLQYYTGKATGSPMQFQTTELDPEQLDVAWGQQFIDSEAYKGLGVGSAQQRDHHFRTMPVALPSLPGLAAAASDVIHTESGRLRRPGPPPDPLGSRCMAGRRSASGISSRTRPRPPATASTTPPRPASTRPPGLP